MKLVQVIAGAVLAVACVGASAFAQPPSTDAKLSFLGSIDWDCDDRIAFNGADGGLHDTVSLLRIRFDEDLNTFKGLFRTSLRYGPGLYSEEYAISGYSFDEDGKQGVLIDTFDLTERASLPSDIAWRDMKVAIYYIRLEGDAMGLDGTWEDTVGGRGPSDCG